MKFLPVIGAVAVIVVVLALLAWVSTGHAH